MRPYCLKRAIQALLALLLTADMGYERLYPLPLRSGGDAVVAVGLVRFPVHPFALATSGLISTLVPPRMRISHPTSPEWSFCLCGSLNTLYRALSANGRSGRLSAAVAFEQVVPGSSHAQAGKIVLRILR